MEAAESTFFPGSNRRVILGSPTLQTTSRRVCIPIRMPLSGESFTGMPDWIGESFAAVSKYLTEASPQVQQIAGVTLAFHNDAPKGELFAPPSAKAPSCELKAFSVCRVEDPDEDPTIELQFKSYIPFTRDFWDWIGQMAGHEVYMAFPSSLGGTVAVSPSKEKALLDDEEGDLAPNSASDEDMPDAPSAEEEFGPEYEDQVRKSMGADKAAKRRMVDARNKGGKKRKNGPKELREYHEKQTQKGSKRGPKNLSLN